jgi:hypothetical protein
MTWSGPGGGDAWACYADSSSCENAREVRSNLADADKIMGQRSDTNISACSVVK